MFVGQTPRINLYPNMQTIWNVLTITNGYIFSTKPNEITSVCYFPPIYLQDPTVLEYQIRNFINTFFLIPTNSKVSIYLVKQEKDYDLIFEPNAKYEILNYLEEKSIEAKNNFNSPEYHTYISITIPISNDFQTISVNSKKSFLEQIKELFSNNSKVDLLGQPGFIKCCKNAIENIENLISQLKSRFNNQVYRLDSRQIAGFMGILLNHNTKSNLSDLSSILKSDVFSNSEKAITHYGGYYNSVLSLRSKSFPKTADFSFQSVYFKEELKNTPFIIKSTIYFVDPLKAKSQANDIIKRLNNYSQVPLLRKYMKELFVQMEMMNYALDQIEIENGRLVDFTFQIFTCSENYEGCIKNSRLIQNVFNSNDAVLKVDKLNHKAGYYSILPFLSELNKIRTRMTSMNTEPFLPISYPAYYVNNPEKPIVVKTLMYTSHNVLTEFDQMDARNPSWNGIICGGSGSGKSFLANYLIKSSLFGNTKVFIIDKGGPGQGSFRNIVQNIPGGRYIEMKWRGEIEFSINFFDGPLFLKDDDSAIIPDINGIPDVQKETFLLQVLTLLAQDNSSRLSKTMESQLSEAIRQIYLETNNNEGNVIDLDYFATEILAPRFPDIYSQVQKYIDSGPYARFFKKTTTMGETDIFCFDLEGLDDHPDLAPIMMMVITHFCYDMCMHNPGIRKMIVIDEAWSALGTPALRTTVENIWRTIRKHGGYIYCITQSFRDIFSSEIGAALLSNTTHYYCVGANHDWEYVSKLKATGNYTNTIDEYDFSQISNMKFVKGEFSEFFMLSPIYKGVLRYRASDYDYWMSTTNADDKEILENVKKEMNVKHLTPEVLEKLLEK